MTKEDIMREVEASFAIEGMMLTKEEKERGMRFLKGEISSEEAILEIRKKYQGDV